MENKADSLPRLISELHYPQYGLYPFLFWKGPPMEQPELVTKFLTVLGAPLNRSSINGWGHMLWVRTIVKPLWPTTPRHQLSVGPLDPPLSRYRV